MNLDEKEMGKLFSKTFIDMQDENKVFELYSIFKYLRGEFPIDKLKYNILDGREESFARFEDESYLYEIYHDSIGRNGISFNIGRKEIEDSGNLYLERKLKILDKKATIYKELEDKNSSNNIWSGRPDLLIIKTDKTNNTIIQISIGEIKYTNDRNYMYTGLEELLEYMYLIKNKNDLYIDDILINGILFVDNIKLKKKEFGEIKIINRSPIRGII